MESNKDDCRGCVLLRFLTQLIFGHHGRVVELLAGAPGQLDHARYSAQPETSYNGAGTTEYRVVEKGNQCGFSRKYAGSYWYGC